MTADTLEMSYKTKYFILYTSIPQKSRVEKKICVDFGIHVLNYQTDLELPKT